MSSGRSRDITGHRGEDGELLKPLAGKSIEEIYRAHHGLDDKGKPIAKFQEVAIGGVNGCECDACEEYLTRPRVDVDKPVHVEGGKPGTAMVFKP